MSQHKIVLITIIALLLSSSVQAGPYIPPPPPIPDGYPPEPIEEEPDEPEEGYNTTNESVPVGGSHGSFDYEQVINVTNDTGRGTGISSSSDNDAFTLLLLAAILWLFASVIGLKINKR